MTQIQSLKPLGGAAEEVLWCLFRNGPTLDGNVPSKSGRDILFERDLIDRYNGWQWLTRSGIMMALSLKFDHKKDAEQNRRQA